MHIWNFPLWHWHIEYALCQKVWKPRIFVNQTLLQDAHILYFFSYNIITQSLKESVIAIIRFRFVRRKTMLSRYYVKKRYEVTYFLFDSDSRTYSILTLNRAPNSDSDSRTYLIPISDTDSDPWTYSTPTPTSELKKIQLRFPTPILVSEYFWLHLRKWKKNTTSSDSDSNSNPWT